MPDIATQRLARPAAAMAVGTALSRITGLGRILAMAFAIGVAESRLADAYNLANTLPNVLYELVLGGTMTSVFIPVVVEELRTRAPAEAWRAVSAMVSVALVVLFAVTAGTFLAAPVIVDLFTGRAQGTAADDGREVATLLLRLFAAQIALYGVIAVVEGLLNAHGRFAAPAFAPIANNLVVIATFVAFGLLVGGTPTAATVVEQPALGVLLGLGTTGGVAVMLLVLLPGARRLPGRLRVRWQPRHPAVRKAARLSAWTLLYVAVNAVGTGVSFYLAGSVQGGLTAYAIAFAFFQLPVGIAAMSILTALVPRLAAHHVDGDPESFRRELARGLEALAFVMLPATAALVILSGPLTELLLEHGVVGRHSAELVASLLRLFALGLLPFAAFQLLVRGAYARQDARTPALVNVAENAVTVACGVALFPRLGLEALAIAHGVGYVVGCLLAWRALRRHAHGPFGTGTLHEVAKSAGCAAVAAIAMGLVVAAGEGGPLRGDAAASSQIVVGGVVGAVTYLTLARALGVASLHAMRAALPRLPPSLRRPRS